MALAEDRNPYADHGVTESCLRPIQDDLFPGAGVVDIECGTGHVLAANLQRTGLQAPS